MKKEFELDAKLKAYEKAGNTSTAEHRDCENDLRHVQAQLYGWRKMRDLYLKEKVDPELDKAAKRECDGKVFHSPSAELVYRAEKHATLHKIPYSDAVNVILDQDSDLAHCYENSQNYVW